MWDGLISADRVDKKVKDTDESVEAMSTLLRKRTIQLATVQSDLDEATRDAHIFEGQTGDAEVPEDETIDETRRKASPSSVFPVYSLIRL